MTDERQEDTSGATQHSGSQSENNSEDNLSRITRPGGEPSDMASAWKNKYIHLLADLENTKKRLVRTSAQEVEAQKKKMLLDILQVADGLDLALIHISSEDDNRNILQGIELIRDILDNFFTEYDVKAMDAWGNLFDPNLHEAIGMVQHPTAAPNTVVRVEKKGYLYHDQLLRPAQVLVASN